MSLSEAMEITSFDIVIPNYMPVAFHLKDVTVLRSQHQYSTEIFLNYEADDKSFFIHQIKATDQFASGFMSTGTTEVEEVTIHEYKGSYIQYALGTAQLIWVTEDMYFSVEGDLTKDDIIEIAKSM